jgi:hypothetical protein
VLKTFFVLVFSLFLLQKQTHTMNTAQLIKLHEKAAHVLEMIQENERRIRHLEHDANSILMLTAFSRDIHKSIADKKAVGRRLEKSHRKILLEIIDIELFT